MGILKDCTAFYFRVKQPNSRHVGTNVCVCVYSYGWCWLWVARVRAEPTGWEWEGPC